MAVIIRLSRKGNRHRPFFHLVAIDSRKKRSGPFLEQLGTYSPLGATALRLDRPAVERWLADGAQLSATVARLLRRDDAQQVGPPPRPATAGRPPAGAATAAAAAPAAETAP